MRVRSMLMPAADGVDMAFHRAAHAKRHHRDAVLGAGAHHRGHLVGGDGEDDAVRPGGRMPRLGVTVVLTDGVGGGDAVAKQLTEPIDQCHGAWHGDPRICLSFCYRRRFCCDFGCHRASPHVHEQDDCLPARAQEEQRPGLVPRAPRRVRAARPRRRWSTSSITWPTTSGRCAGTGGRPEGVAVPPVARHPVQRGQGAAEDEHRRRVPQPHARPDERRRPLLRGGHDLGLDWRRRVRARLVAAACHPRAHRHQPARSSRRSSGRRPSRSWAG